MKTCKCENACLFILLSFAFTFLNSNLSAQADSLQKPFSFSGYVEGYYSYDFSKPPDKLKPPFFYSFNRHNEPNINIAMLKGSYSSAGFRANVGLMAGTYVNYNLAAEPDVLGNIYELNLGFKIANQLWLDAGVFGSHIGFETPIGKDCWNLTRSIMADNSPYYETGLRLGYETENRKWYAAFFLLTGWQRIKPVEGNSLPSFGTQIQFKPNEKWVFNSSSFIGTDKPDSARKMRYYHDLYSIYNVSSKLGLQLAFDIGMEQKSTGSSGMNSWYSIVFGSRLQCSKKIYTGFRLEYYKDQHGVIASTETGASMDVFGASLNVDYSILPNLIGRVEGRILNGNNVFLKEGLAVNNNQAFTACLAFTF